MEYNFFVFIWQWLEKNINYERNVRFDNDICHLSYIARIDDLKLDLSFSYKYLSYYTITPSPPSPRRKIYDI